MERRQQCQSHNTPEELLSVALFLRVGPVP